MTDQPTVTVAGHSIGLHVNGYPDVPNRWGSGHIRVDTLRLDYGSNRTPAARHAQLAGLWVREDGEVTDQPIDRYYEAPDGDTSTWPDWIAELAVAHVPAVPVPPTTHATDPAAVLLWAADAIDAAFTGPNLDRYTRYGADLLRRLADQAQQRCNHSFPDPFPASLDHIGDCRRCGVSYQAAKAQRPAASVAVEGQPGIEYRDDCPACRQGVARA